MAEWSSDVAAACAGRSTPPTLHIWGIPYYYALFPWKQTLKLTTWTTELDITGVPGSVAIVVESKETVPWQRASSVPAVGPKVSRMFPPIILSRCVLKNIVSVAIPEAFNLEYIPVHASHETVRQVWVHWSNLCLWRERFVSFSQIHWWCSIIFSYVCCSSTIYGCSLTSPELKYWDELFQPLMFKR